MKKNGSTYFNVPIGIFEGFISEPKEVMCEVMDWSIYNYLSNKHEETEVMVLFKYFDEAEDYYEIINDIDFESKCFILANHLAYGKKLCEQYPSKSNPKVGVSRDICFDFYKNYKSEFHCASLLAFLAIKSILGRKTYCKITKNYLYARMDGKNKSYSDLTQVSPELQKFTNRYQFDKIIGELEDGWGLKYYSRNMRGFYVSFKLEYEELGTEVEKRRITRKRNNKKELKNAINQKILAKFGDEF